MRTAASALLVTALVGALAGLGAGTAAAAAAAAPDPLVAGVAPDGPTTAAGVAPDETTSPTDPSVSSADAAATAAAARAPQKSVSRYVTDLTGSQTSAQITGVMRPHGCADAELATSAAPHVAVLEFGAQSAKAGGDGSGTGSTRGVRLPTTDMRITDAQVVTAVKAYLIGYRGCRPATATGTATVAVGTNTSGFAGSTYTPAAKGTEWASQVVVPLAAAGQAAGITVVGADDVEANFDAQIGEVTTWITAYLAVSGTTLINNGAASGCPTGAGVTGRTCRPVPVEDSDPPATNTWTQAQYASVSGGLAPGRISVLPQIYAKAQAAQWEAIDLTAVASGAAPLTFAGVLTQVAACGGTCTSLTPSAAWVAMRAALDSDPVTTGSALPSTSDIRYP